MKLYWMYFSILVKMVVSKDVVFIVMRLLVKMEDSFLVVI